MATVNEHVLDVRVKGTHEACQDSEPEGHKDYTRDDFGAEDVPKKSA